MGVPACRMRTRLGSGSPARGQRRLARNRPHRHRPGHLVPAIGFRTHGLARAEIATFRYRVLHVAARITRQLRLRIDSTWRWASAITTAWQRIRTAFG